MRHNKLTVVLFALFSLFVTSCKEQIPPLVYDKEYSGGVYETPYMPTICELPEIEQLPDPFAWADGSGRSTDFSDWEKHRYEIMQQFWHYELGFKPTVERDSITATLVDDTLRVSVRVGGEILTLTSPIILPDGEGPFPLVIGVGFPSGSLPKELFEQRSIARMPFNFMQVMSHTQKRGTEPINKLYPTQTAMGAYTAWPWGVSRLIDGLEIIGVKSKIDMTKIAVTGCSFAGKMALFSGAFDERIALTIAQEPGGGGVASWRVSETLGNVETLGRTNYAWFLESMRQFADSNINKLPIDHHMAAALIAPRALLVLGNTDYEWLADESTYVSCQAARKVWETFGIADRMGFTIEGNHNHCQVLESQIPEIGAFLDKFLLGKKDVKTDITRADMFKDVDYNKWIPWADQK